MYLLLKKIIKKILVIFFSLKQQVRVTGGSIVSYTIIKSTYKSNFLSGVICYGNVKVGKFSSLNGPSTKIVAQINNIKIGSFCSIASGVVIQEYYHKYERLSTFYMNQYFFNKSFKEDIFSKGDIIIEDDVWIGANCVILSGVTIGRGSIIGAGSIVTKDIEKYSIVGGNPAKVLRRRFSTETIDIVENLKWWTWDIKKIKRNKVLFNLDLGKEIITEELIQ